MSFKFIVSSVLVGNIDKITIDDIIPAVFVYDDKDLDKAIAYAKLESDKDNPLYKIEVNTIFEEHPAYKALNEKFRERNTAFGNVPYAKYVVNVEKTLGSGNILKSCFITTITFHNIL